MTDMPQPRILTFGEFRKLRGAQKKPLIVYQDENRFTNLFRGVAPKKGKPGRNGVTFTLTTLPLMRGGFVEISAPGGKGPYIDSNGALRARKPGATDGGGCTVVWKGIFVCEGSCSAGQSCGLAVMSQPVVLARVAGPNFPGGLTGTVVSCGCGCS
jgi:hypothetical protein